ncbi:hypothetical protein BGY98DRAFT_1146326 [Russula aff. rugulosa BPL654]|nr:hypothetical protein BGY98DRAFT_1146326 [Russula aff. rugulosa BPL654]
MLQSIIKMFSSKSLSKKSVSPLSVKLQETQEKDEKTAADALVASDKLEAPETPENSDALKNNAHFQAIYHQITPRHVSQLIRARVKFDLLARPLHSGKRLSIQRDVHNLTTVEKAPLPATMSKYHEKTSKLFGGVEARCLANFPHQSKAGEFVKDGVHTWPRRPPGLPAEGCSTCSRTHKHPTAFLLRQQPVYWLLSANVTLLEWDYDDPQPHFSIRGGVSAMGKTNLVMRTIGSKLLYHLYSSFCPAGV